MRPVEIQPDDLFKPRLQFAQVLLILLNFSISELANSALFRDLGFEITAPADEFLIGLLVRFGEARDHLLLLDPVEPEGFEEDRVALHCGDFVLQELQTSYMQFDLR